MSMMLYNTQYRP